MGKLARFVPLLKSRGHMLSMLLLLDLYSDELLLTFVVVTNAEDMVGSAF